MSKQIQWTIHRDDSKIETVETIDDDNLADRYVSSGMAVYVEDEAPEPEPEAVDPEPAPADSKADKSAPAKTPAAPAPGTAAANKQPTDASEVTGKS